MASTETDIHLCLVETNQDLKLENFLEYRS